MGMSASQARLLGLQARQSNLEYQGQQINQERTILSQQCTALYNSLLAMQVPTPPSTQDFTTIEYSGSDGASKFTIGTVKPSGENYNVEIRTTETGNALQSDYGSKVVAKAGAEVKGTKLADTNIGALKANELTKYYVIIDDKVEQLSTNSIYVTKNDSGSCSLKQESITGATIFKAGEGEESINNPNAGATTVAGNVVYDFREAAVIFPQFSWSEYETAIKNTFGSSNESIDADDFYVYIHTSDTGIESVKFALKSDVETKNEDGSSNIGDGFAKTYSFIPNGTFTKSDPVDGCKLQFDTQGRIHTISIPEYDTQRNLIGYRDVELTAKTVTDEAAYQDAYNQYEYKQYEYDKTQQEINRKTEIIQQEDRNLELKLQRLDNERTQITTEIEAVEKVIQENIESSYKTFSG